MAAPPAWDAEAAGREIQHLAALDVVDEGLLHAGQ